MQTQIDTTPGDILIPEEYYLRASKGKRFLNYLIDVIVFYFITLGISIVLLIFWPEFENILAESEGVGFKLIDQVVSLILYALYMFALESIFKGKSFGKMVTRTRAVNLDGSRISPGTALARAFARAVPFSAFSALGDPSNPWQDRWTNTMVVDETSIR